MYGLKIVVLFTLILIFCSYSQGASLSTFEVDKVDTGKSYTLILYGGRHYNDLETIAIFDIEGDGYTFEPFAPNFDYLLKKGLSSEEAMINARAFVSGHFAFRRALLSKILNKEGAVIGYELRPIYYPLLLGESDPIDVDYWQKNGKIKVTISLKPSMDRRLFDLDGSRDFLK
jgi:hypothetical protein